MHIRWIDQNKDILTSIYYINEQDIYLSSIPIYPPHHVLLYHKKSKIFYFNHFIGHSNYVITDITKLPISLHIRWIDQNKDILTLIYYINELDIYVSSVPIHNGIIIQLNLSVIIQFQTCYSHFTLFCKKF